MPNADWRHILRENVSRVRQDIAAACARAGRPADSVRLVAVTKYVSVAVLRELVAAGVTDIGESRAQQLAARVAECGTSLTDWPAPGAPETGGAVRWHMIGHLQRNKVKLVLPQVRIVHSLDSDRLARALDECAAQHDCHVDVFIEVNVTGEGSKEGVVPEALPALLEVIAACPRIRARGLMTMAPFDPDPETARSCFVRLRELRDRLRQAGDAGATCVELSMGMSQDYVVAVEEGATYVRVGSALFEGLPSTDPRAG